METFAPCFPVMAHQAEDGLDRSSIPTSSSAGRLSAVDTVKGIAIILMAFGHVLQGAFHRHLWAGQPHLTGAAIFAETFIYSFHMPAFFFVAGLFLAGSLNRRGALGFTLEKMKTILYPYVLWGILGGVLAALTARFRVTEIPSNWHSVLTALLTGNSSWFLISLFICQMLGLVLHRLPYWVQMSIALAASYLVPSVGITTLYSPFQYLPFLIAGMWFSGKRLSVVERVWTLWAWIAFVVLLGAQLALIDLLGPVTWWDRFPLGLIGISMLVFLAQAVRGSATDRVLRWYGAGSLGVFVLSPFFQGIGREFVTRVFHTTHPLPYLGITTAVAATAPVVIWDLQDRFHFVFLFRWPSSKKHVAPRKSQTMAG
jgi:fucose 4-O-acetylase-like acetyltransferase